MHQLEASLIAYASQGALATMWLLVILSVICVAVFVERVVRRRADRTDPALLTALETTPRWSGDLMDRLEKADGLEARALKAGVIVASGGADAVEAQLAAEMIRARETLSENLLWLGTIGANAPFIGLFGTVLGVLRAFGDLSLDTQGGAEAVMGGISEALVATAIGLAVAIPAVMMFNYLNRRNERVLERVVALGHQLVGAVRATDRSALGV